MYVVVYTVQLHTWSTVYVCMYICIYVVHTSRNDIYVCMYVCMYVVYTSSNDKCVATGVDVQSILRAFYRRHYSPSAMKLVVVGPQSLTELEQAVWAAAGDWQAEPVAAEEVG